MKYGLLLRCAWPKHEGSVVARGHHGKYVYRMFNHVLVCRWFLIHLHSRGNAQTPLLQDQSLDIQGQESIPSYAAVDFNADSFPHRQRVNFTWNLASAQGWTTGQMTHMKGRASGAGRSFVRRKHFKTNHFKRPAEPSQLPAAKAPFSKWMIFRLWNKGSGVIKIIRAFLDQVIFLLR